jgi:hypothetical protein
MKFYIFSNYHCFTFALVIVRLFSFSFCFIDFRILYSNVLLMLLPRLLLIISPIFIFAKCLKLSWSCGGNLEIAVSVSIIKLSNHSLELVCGKLYCNPLFNRLI